MGFTPAQVDAMSLWQYLACLDGYRAAHSGQEKSEPLGDLDETELRAMGIVGF